MFISYFITSAVCTVLHGRKRANRAERLLTAHLPPPLHMHHLPYCAFSSAQLHETAALDAAPPHRGHTTLSARVSGRKSSARAMGALQDLGQAPSSVFRVRACTFLPPGQSGPWSMWELWSGEKESWSRVPLLCNCHGVYHIPSNHPFPYAGDAWKFRM